MDDAPAHGRRETGPFDTFAAVYDRLGYLTATARHLVACAALRPGERVLDVATGTGSAALAAAARVGPSGTVTGIDLAEYMLEVARARAGAAGLTQLSFRQADAARLPFENASFDALLCASGLFFMPDLQAALREWRRVLVPGGQLAFSSFGAGLLEPLATLFARRLAPHGLSPGWPPFERVPSPQAAEALLRAAGFSDPHARLDRLTYRLPDPETRWAEITAGLEGAPLARLDPSERQRLREAHLDELREHFQHGPLEVQLPVIVALGWA